MFQPHQKVKIKRHAQRTLPIELRQQTGCVVEIGQELTYMYKVQFEDGTVRWMRFNEIEEYTPGDNVWCKLCAILSRTKGLQVIARIRQAAGNNRTGAKAARRQADRAKDGEVK